MRFIVMVKATRESEAGALPDGKMLAAMGKYNEELVKAGVMLAAEGLQPTAKGTRIRFSGGRPASVVDGPFTESKELIAGFWIWQVRSKEEAVEWLKRAPFNNEEIEIRQIFEPADFAPSDPTGELRKAQEELAAKVSQGNR